MCLAIPGKVLSIEDSADAPRMAEVSFGGIIKKASLEILPEAKEGDYVLVHVGVAISKVDEAEANKTYQFLKDFGELNELENES
jgi:hydrogenase expression/formation protein HypC